jgi:Holliday junction DNA helicase RuvA
MGILNKFSISEIINAINTQNKKLICSVPGIGQKMCERLILELKSRFKNELYIEEEKRKEEFQIKDNEINKMVDDLQITLTSLNYTKNQVKKILPIIIKETDNLSKRDKKTSFEDLLKLAMNYLDNDSSNIVV